MNYKLQIRNFIEYGHHMLSTRHKHQFQDLKITLAPYHPITLSPYHLITLSPYHPTTLSPNHPITLDPYPTPIHNF